MVVGTARRLLKATGSWLCGTQELLAKPIRRYIAPQEEHCAPGSPPCDPHVPLQYWSPIARRTTSTATVYPAARASWLLNPIPARARGSVSRAQAKFCNSMSIKHAHSNILLPYVLEPSLTLS